MGFLTIWQEVILSNNFIWFLQYTREEIKENLISLEKFRNLNLNETLTKVQSAELSWVEYTLILCYEFGALFNVGALPSLALPFTIFGSKYAEIN